MSWKLVKFKMDWADEFDVEGFRVIDSDIWKEIEEKIKIAKNISWGFGTNEGWENEDGLSFFKSCVAEDISIEEYETFKRSFKIYKNNIGFGRFPDFQYWIKNLDEDGNYIG